MKSQWQTIHHKSICSYEPENEFLSVANKQKVKFVEVILWEQVQNFEDLQYKWYLKILLKWHKPLGECNLQEFSNITSTVSFCLSFHSLLCFTHLLNYWKNHEHMCLFALRCKVWIFNDQLACSKANYRNEAFSVKK